jgi:hypothetical protein
MFQVLILICSTGLAPADCQIDTALDVVRGPEVANEVMCGMHGQAYIATTAITPRSDKEFVKIRCIPSKSAQHALDLRASIAVENQRLNAIGALGE